MAVEVFRDDYELLTLTKRAIRSLLARPIAYHRAFADIAGVKGAILLSQLYYWDGKQEDPDGWIYKTDEELMAETGLSRHELAGARNDVKVTGVLETKRRGVPARLYYRIRFEVLSERLSYPKSGQLVPGSAGTGYPKSGQLSTLTEITSEITTHRSGPSDLGQLALNGQSPVPLAPVRFEEKKPDADAPKPEDLIEGWNEIAAGGVMAPVRVLSPTRRRKCLLRLQEHPDDDFWTQVFANFKTSAFLRGVRPDRERERSGHANWCATFDWLVENDTNCVKVFEGVYNR